MTPAELVQLNLLTPMAMCFALGFAATFLKSDLRLPPGAYTVLSAYLMFAIGLKGGVALSHYSMAQLGQPIAVTILLGALIPVLIYNISRRVGRLDRANSGALAAHYGSVSAVTFIACLTFLEHAKVSHEGYMPALVAVMEIPGILIALTIARYRDSHVHPHQHDTPYDALFPPVSTRKSELQEAVREVLTGKSIVLLGGGLLIGAVTGDRGYGMVKSFFVDPFQGVLCLFMLEMGLLAAGRLSEVKKVGTFIIGLGLLAPFLLGALGVGAGYLAGLSVGGMAVLGTLSASASYIAAPAAVRAALPAANPSLYLVAAVGITFPINLTIGIPTFLYLAQLLKPG